jgi:hypothetical protein
MADAHGEPGLAGEAGTGIGELIAYCLHRRTGKSLEVGAEEPETYVEGSGLITWREFLLLQINTCMHKVLPAIQLWPSPASHRSTR